MTLYAEKKKHQTARAQLKVGLEEDKMKAKTEPVAKARQEDKEASVPDSAEKKRRLKKKRKRSKKKLPPKQLKPAAAKRKAEAAMVTSNLKNFARAAKPAAKKVKKAAVEEEKLELLPEEIEDASVAKQKEMDKEVQKELAKVPGDDSSEDGEPVKSPPKKKKRKVLEDDGEEEEAAAPKKKKADAPKKKKGVQKKPRNHADLSVGKPKPPAKEDAPPKEKSAAKLAKEGKKEAARQQRKKGRAAQPIQAAMNALFKNIVVPIKSTMGAQACKLKPDDENTEETFVNVLVAFGIMEKSGNEIIEPTAELCPENLREVITLEGEFPDYESISFSDSTMLNIYHLYASIINGFKEGCPGTFEDWVKSRLGAEAEYSTSGLINHLLRNNVTWVPDVEIVKQAAEWLKADNDWKTPFFELMEQHNMFYFNHPSYQEMANQELDIGDFINKAAELHIHPRVQCVPPLSMVRFTVDRFVHDKVLKKTSMKFTLEDDGDKTTVARICAKLDELLTIPGLNEEVYPEYDIKDPIDYLVVVKKSIIWGKVVVKPRYGKLPILCFDNDNDDDKYVECELDNVAFGHGEEINSKHWIVEPFIKTSGVEYKMTVSLFGSGKTTKMKTGQCVDHINKYTPSSGDYALVSRADDMNKYAGNLVTKMFENHREIPAFKNSPLWINMFCMRVDGMAVPKLKGLELLGAGFYPTEWDMIVDAGRDWAILEQSGEMTARLIKQIYGNNKKSEYFGEHLL